MTTLENAKVGGKIAISCRGNILYERTIARVLKTWIVDDKGDRWRIGWGDSVGGHSSYRAELWTDDTTTRLENQKREEEVRSLHFAIRDFNWRQLPLETLRTVAAFMPKKEGE